jgi:hypothetical protein
MNIHYEIRETPEYGKGIFALADMAAGVRIWTYQLNANVYEYNEQQCIEHLETLPNLSAQQSFLNYSFGKGEKLCLILDDGQYMNHADASFCNCQTDLLSGDCFSRRAIKCGEQLFEDYAAYSHPTFLYALLQKYKCEPDYYAMPPESAIED